MFVALIERGIEVVPPEAFDESGDGPQEDASDIVWHEPRSIDLLAARNELAQYMHGRGDDVFREYDRVTWHEAIRYEPHENGECGQVNRLQVGQKLALRTRFTIGQRLFVETAGQLRRAFPLGGG